jgi:prolyl oligopeptidase
VVAGLAGVAICSSARAAPATAPRLVARRAATTQARSAAPEKPSMSSPKYPPARTVEVVDDYHGTRVADPYRWLEDASSPETQAWVEAENALTRSVLDGTRRDAIKERLAGLHDYPRARGAEKHGARYFFSRNSGLQNQDEVMVQDGLAAPPRLLLDPNALSADGTVALSGGEISDDGRLFAYALSTSGSDRQEIRIRDAATGQDRPDRILWAKFASISWLSDGTGFYYTRFPEPGTVVPADENYFCKVFFHRLGDDQSKDTLVFERRDDREVVFGVALTSDDRYLLITGYKGASDKSDVHVVDRKVPGSPPVPLFRGFDHEWSLIESVGSRLFFRTDSAAPLGRIVAVTLPDRLQPVPQGRGPGEPLIDGATLTQVVAEQRDKLSEAVLVKDRLVVSYLHDASHQLWLFALSGTPLGEVALPTLGSITGLSGEPGDKEFFFDFESFTAPKTPYRYDVASGSLAPFARTATPVSASAYETSQAWFTSKDGTKVSMFLVHKKGVAADGRRPVWLSGYGGFNISVGPAFDPSLFVWLDAGGIYALANLRGGGEYGEAWHEAGMLGRKQNVFNDLIAAAEWLVANNYTTPSRLAIEGASNGGLLVGAAMLQRPDLFGAVLCRVPVADMLRYHLFTVGRFWIPEYGSSEDPAQFSFLYRYSPYHNVKDGVAYPATLVMTADTDDRVAPGMAKKFAARLQAATAGPAPVLIRVETKAGHGAGKPVSKVIDEDADMLVFLFKALGLE